MAIVPRPTLDRAALERVLGRAAELQSRDTGDGATALTDEQILCVLPEMSRVSRRGIVVIDLERNPKDWFLYQLFCLAYRISPLVRQDGSLSIRKGFKVEEFERLVEKVELKNALITRSKPFRVVLSSL